MNIHECLREQEVIDAAQCDRWPEDLRLQLTQCALCADLLEVARAIHDDRESGLADVRVPSAGLVWWRAELRARQEAMRNASRPITFVQAFGAACTAGVVFALISRAWPWLKSLLELPDFSALSLAQWGVLLAFTLALLVVAPLAMYLVLSDE